jgi:hypothetical protein
VAEPDGGVDVGSDPAIACVLRRDADAGVRAELDGGGAAVPVGLSEERSAGQESATSTGKYTLLEAMTPKGERLMIGDEIEAVPEVDGRPG